MIARDPRSRARRLSFLAIRRSLTLSAEDLRLDEEMEAERGHQAELSKDLDGELRESVAQGIQVGASEGDERDRAARDGGAPPHGLRSHGRVLRERGRRLEGDERNLLTAGEPVPDFDEAASHDEKGCAGRPLFVNVLAVPVAPLVGGASEANEVMAPEFLEQADAAEELDEAPFALCLGSGNRPEGSLRRGGQAIRGFTEPGTGEKNLSETEQRRPVLHGRAPADRAIRFHQLTPNDSSLFFRGGRSPSTVIFEKSVLGFILSSLAAPRGPETRPPLRSRAITMASRWCFSIVARDRKGSEFGADGGWSATVAGPGSNQSSPSCERMTARSIAFSSSRMLPGQSRDRS